MKRHLRLVLLLCLFLFGVAATAAGYTLNSNRSQQVDSYNQAMQALSDGDGDAALRLLDQSILDYEQRARAATLEHLLHGRPSSELAALAHFHKGVLLLAKAQQEKRPGIAAQAVDEFKQSLRLNPGPPYAHGIELDQANRLEQQALTVKHDLELLFANQPEQKGQGESGPSKEQQQPQQPQQAPSEEPGTSPGNSNGPDL